MEKSSLNFHKFIWYVWMPLSFVSSLRTMIVRICSVVRTYSYLNEEIFATVVLCYLIFELIFVAVPVLVFIGFFSWKKYAWYLLFFESLSNIIFKPVSILINFGTASTASVLGSFLGIALDFSIVLFYWKRRQLFGIRLCSKEKVKTPPKDTDTILLNTPINNMVTYCRRCGKSIHPEASYCRFCGTKINVED